MTDTSVVGILSGAMLMALKLAGPILAVCLVVGLVVAVVQTITQIQEMTLTFVPKLLGAAGVNLAVGLVLAFVSGLPFYAFDVAGSITEIGAGLSAAQVLDPAGSHTSGVLSGMFNMAALAILLAVGGDRVIVQGIARS